MSNVNTLPALTQLVINTTANKGVGFASIFYTNKSGETARHLVNVNASLQNAKAKDLKTLEALTDKDLEAVMLENPNLDIETLREALAEMIQSIVKPNENRSNGQIEAYTRINEAMKYHNTTGDIYLFALRVKKEVIQSGTYKEVKSAPKTIAKRKIEKHFDLKAPNFVNFKIDQMFSAKLNGDTLVFEQLEETK